MSAARRAAALTFGVLVVLVPAYLLIVGLPADGPAPFAGATPAPQRAASVTGGAAARATVQPATTPSVVPASAMPPATPGAPATPTREELAAALEPEVVAAYLAFWDAYEATLATGDVSLVAAHAGGAALAHIEEQLRLFDLYRLAGRIDADHDVTIAAVLAPTLVSVRDRIADRSVAIPVGSLAAPTGREEVRELGVTLALRDGRWVVNAGGGAVMPRLELAARMEALNFYFDPEFHADERIWEVAADYVDYLEALIVWLGGGEREPLRALMTQAAYESLERYRVVDTLTVVEHHLIWQAEFFDFLEWLEPALGVRIDDARVVDSYMTSEGERTKPSDIQHRVVTLAFDGERWLVHGDTLRRRVE